MAEVVPFPRSGELFSDARGSERTMRVSHHPEHGLVVVSLWRGPTCRASFQLPVDDVARLSELLGSLPAGLTAGPERALPAADSVPDEPAAGSGSPPEDLPQAC
jgi:hypothetical protein